MEMGSKWAGTVVVIVALAVAGCDDTADHGGDQVLPSSTQPTSVLTIAGKAERVTDVAAFAITDEEAKEIERACAEAGGVPGGSEECAAIVRDRARERVRDCGDTPDACLVAGRVTDGGIAYLILDRRPGSPACSERQSSLCNGAIFSAEFAPPTDETTSSSETTNPTSPGSTSPSPISPATTSSSPDESTPATESGESESP